MSSSIDARAAILENLPGNEANGQGYQGRDDHQVIEVAQDRDEIRDEVDRGERVPYRDP